jgi:pimeloyl-ACP methyl ester carboxylesterase
MRARTVELDGHRRLHLYEGGEGRPVMILHGAFLTGADWAIGPAAPLAERFRALAVDRPGHGLSNRRRGEAAPARQAAQVREAAARLGVERPVLIGHSAGALTALAWAAERPEEVAGVVLVAPIVFSEVRLIEQAIWGPRAVPLAGEAAAWIARWTIDPVMLPLVDRLIFAPQDPPETWRTGFPHDQVLTASAGIANGEDADVLVPGSPAMAIPFERITAPVEALYGDADRVVDPRRHAERLPRVVPHARVTRLPGLGHMPHWFAAEEVVAAVERCLAREVATA